MDRLDLSTLKSRWNEVLDLLEQENRIAWLAFFDARLVSLDNNNLKLSFVDAEKLSGAHDYAYVRKDSHRAALEAAIKSIFGISVVIITE
ncbi:MAG: hypothetical protein EBV63_04250 [Actinobacteria bacterium]|jgi:hypothetical protein|nr:hypothetical protein [Actinomycetota bacterium]NCU89895.1 hypothetical protein [Actinomycetota bacterium]NDE54270.1 hypothetical protein [Actinomycetota bacterium]